METARSWRIRHTCPSSNRIQSPLSNLLSNICSRCPHLVDRPLTVASIELDTPHALYEQHDTKSKAECVEHCGADAVVGGQAEDVDFVDALGLQILGQPR